MTRTTMKPILTIIVLLTMAAYARETPSDQGAEIRSFTVGQAVAPTLSKPVRSLPKAKAWQPGDPVRTVPRRPFMRETLQDEQAAQREETTTDAAHHAPFDTLAVAESGLNFDGIGYTGVMPPDTIGDVGPSNYIQMVNSDAGAQFVIYDKSGTLLSGPTELSNLWASAGQSGSPCATAGWGDPIVMYDHLADRWFLSQFALPNGDFPPYYLAIAVSQTSNPQGAYHVYCFEVNTAFPDYPKYAVWPDAYYLATNEEDANPDVGAWAFDRDKMLLGQAATFQKFTVQRNFMLPCDLDGSTTPPTGAPNYFYTMMDDTYWPSQGFPGVDRLEIWEFHVDWDTPANSSFTHTLNITNTPFNYDVGGSSWNVIPQPGTSQKVDAIGEWPMWRLQYRNFGTHETLVGNFTVNVGGTLRAGIRWFELRKSAGGIWGIHQEGTYSPDNNHRWMGSVAMDGYGSIALGYSVSSGSVYPSIRYAVRLASDPNGTLGDETNLYAGTASQTHGNRWGDYSAMTVDPADDITFWYTPEYIGADHDWRTRIGTFVVVPEPFVGVMGLMGLIGLMRHIGHRDLQDRC